MDAKKSSALSTSRGHISQGAPESSHSSPARAGYGRPLWIQILPRGRFMLNILLQSSTTYRESIVVCSQHYSRVAI